MDAKTTVACGLAALGRLRVPIEALAELRRRPGPAPASFPPSFLKHSEEQTVYGLAAVYHAINDFGLDPASFRDWGVLAAPRFLARTTIGANMTRFAQEGAWGVSPHVIPHRSLHSLSGSISQALKIQGPNFGIGGGPNAPGELLLNALALLEGQRLPGLWVVATEFQPDPAPQPAPGSMVLGLAMGLVPWSASSTLPRLTLSLAAHPGKTEPLRLDRLLNGFEPAPGTTSRVELDQGGWLEVAWPPSARPAPVPVSCPSPLAVETER